MAGTRSRTLYILSLIVLGSACKAPYEEHRLVEPKTGRPYTVVESDRHPEPTGKPALFVLHAFMTDPEWSVRDSWLKGIVVDRKNWLMIVPEGLKDKNGHHCWNASVGCCAKDMAIKPDDVGYLRSVLSDVETRFNVDENRVFAFGASNGGFMAHRWACDSGGQISGIISIAGVGPGEDDPPCSPGNRVDILQVHGKQDQRILYEGKDVGADPYPSVKDTVSMWTRLNRLPMKPTEENRWTLLLGAVERETWQDNRSRVSLWTVADGGHHLNGLRYMLPELIDFLDSK